MTTHAMLEPVPLEVVPGAELTCRLLVRNTGDVVEAYRLEVVGEAARWAVVEPATVSLYPGTETTATVVFRPPRSARVPAGEVPFAVRVVPSERPRDAVAPEGVVAVLPFTETTAEIVPHTSAGRRGARHEVAVDNRGNVPVSATVGGVDPDGRLAVRARPETVVVPPGQAVFATVAVRNRRLLWRGQPATRPFQVVVAPEGEPPIALPAATVQTPVVPKTAPRLAAVLAAVLAALVAAWFLLLKPAVRSTAKDAVDKPLAAVAQQANNADKKADAAKSQADKTAANGAQGAQPAPPAVPPATTTAARLRLQTLVDPGNTPGSATHTVPDKTTLLVTELVLENPQGDTGRVDVLVDNAPILTLALANFRDLDYHFGSPIEVPAGKTLSIRTTCQTPGPALVGFTGNQCRVWTFVGGVNRVTAPGA